MEKRGIGENQLSFYKQIRGKYKYFRYSSNEPAKQVNILSLSGLHIGWQFQEESLSISHDLTNFFPGVWDAQDIFSSEKSDGNGCLVLFCYIPHSSCYSRYWILWLLQDQEKIVTKQYLSQPLPLPPYARFAPTRSLFPINGRVCPPSKVKFPMRKKLGFFVFFFFLKFFE